METWMAQLEAKHIFHEQNPEKYHTKAHIAIDGDNDVEYPLKLSNKWMESILHKLNFKLHKHATSD